MTSFVIGLIVIALLAIAAACIFAWRFSKEKKLRIQREKETKLLEPLSQREPVNEQEVEFGPGVEFDDEPEQEPMEEPVKEPQPKQELQQEPISQPPIVEELEQKIVEIEEVQVGPQTVDTKVVLDENSDNASEDEQEDEEDKQNEEDKQEDEEEKQDEDEDEEVVIHTRSSRRRK